jgi:hypothetical protein
MDSTAATGEVGDEVALGADVVGRADSRVEDVVAGAEDSPAPMATPESMGWLFPGELRYQERLKRSGMHLRTARTVSGKGVETRGNAPGIPPMLLQAGVRVDKAANRLRSKLVLEADDARREAADCPAAQLVLEVVDAFRAVRPA